jgi:hypothetical protein
MTANLRRIENFPHVILSAAKDLGFGWRGDTSGIISLFVIHLIVCHPERSGGSIQYRNSRKSPKDGIS